MPKNRILKLSTLFLCVWTVLSFRILAENTSYYFHQLTIDKGLSQSSVTGILSATDGMMWIGTNSGLNLFDRHEVKSFFYDEDIPHSLPGNYVYFVTEDAVGTIWVSTNKGLVRYQRSDNSFRPLTTEKAVISRSFFSTPDAIYFGGDNALYKYVYDEKKLESYPIKIASSYPFRVNFIVSPHPDELILISRDQDIVKYDLKNRTYRQLHFPDRFSIISKAYLDKNGDLYLAPYKDGLYCYDKSWKKKFHLTTANSELTNNIILDIIEKDNKMWLATDGGGVSVLDKKDLSIMPIRHIPGDISSMPVNSITCLYKDRQDNMFAGSVRGGMFGIKEVFIKTYRDVPLHCPYGLTEKAVISLYEDKEGILWVGTDGGGVNRYDPVTDSFTHYTTLPHGKVVSITSFSDTELLVSLYSDRTYLFNKLSGKCTPFDIVSPEITRQQCEADFVEMAFRLSSKRIYFLSSTAYIYDVNAKTFSTLKTKENPNFLQALDPIYADEKVAFFIQYKGNCLFKVEQESDSLSTMLRVEGEVIRAACRDEQGIFWIGTDCGLSYFDPRNNELRRMDTQLFNNVATLLYDNQGRLWIGAQNMLFSYDIRKKKFILWGESDGFTLNELPFAYQAPPRHNNIYLGGVSGLVRIDRRISSQDEILPQMKLVDLQVDGNSMLDQLAMEKPELTVPWNYSSLVMKVLSLEKDIFRKKLFRYTIVGENRQQTVTYDHTFALQTLSPGTYDIEVSCNAKNGDWTVPQKMFRLVITPPWYKDSKNLAGFFIFILGGVVWGMFLFMQRKEKKMLWAMDVHEQKMNKEKVQFLINVSHELRTPLTLAYAPLKRILDRKEWELPGNNLQGNLLNIYKQMHHMKDLINMVLDLNKINDEENALHKTSHSINQWMEAVADDFKTELEEKKITFVMELDRRAPIVSFDSLKCTSVLSNLLMNALKFSDQGTTITLASKVLEDKVRVSVADQGIGLGNVDMNKLFTRYYQGGHDKLGSGIGLSYAKVLMEKHGGSIGAMENDPKGAVFYFELPLDEAVTSEANTMITCDLSPMNYGIEKGDEDFSTSDYVVLVVEDNDELREFIRQTLQGVFKKVYTASDGVQGVAVTKEKLPDIVVSDVMMPQMDGFEMCRRIKEDIATSHIPVVLLTARGDTGSMNIGYRQGADTYLSKPFEEELLLTVIVNQLKNRETLKKKYRESGFHNPPQSVPVNNLDEEFLYKLNKLINDHIDLKTLDVKFLTLNMGMSRTPLFTKLKALTNMGINDYVNRIRIERAAQLLTTTALSIGDIADAVGFDSPKYFSTLFKQIKEMTPSQFRESQGA